ncbi:hypothetical protein DYB32_008162 [Aphanomyces invadans]|uniref:Uncharacterized protein n=1 Tax=Aphanomyces invadans TaxID=157072 RepID=A0A3R7CVW5_9STRA|nr:hypothetical protein DYB32_008162 [Aphanomyces invadans]
MAIPTSVCLRACSSAPPVHEGQVKERKRINLIDPSVTPFITRSSIGFMDPLRGALLHAVPRFPGRSIDWIFNGSNSTNHGRRRWIRNGSIIVADSDRRRDRLQTPGRPFENGWANDRMSPHDRKASTTAFFSSQRLAVYTQTIADAPGVSHHPNWAILRDMVDNQLPKFLAHLQVQIDANDAKARHIRAQLDIVRQKRLAVQDCILQFDTYPAIPTPTASASSA